MKTVSLVISLFLVLVLAGCGATGSRMMDTTDGDLIDKVAYDTNCPAEQIEITNRLEKKGFADYKITACGENLEYKRTGSVFHAADVDPLAAAQ